MRFKLKKALFIGLMNGILGDLLNFLGGSSEVKMERSHLDSPATLEPDHVQPNKMPDQTQISENFGSIQKPLIYNITYGERFKNSLLFHCKVGPQYVCYRLRNVNSKTINLECANHATALRRRGKQKINGCFAKAKVAVIADLIKLSETPRKNGEKTRKSYFLDFEDKRVLLPESYEVLPHNSEFHNVTCQTTFFPKGFSEEENEKILLAHLFPEPI